MARILLVGFRPHSQVRIGIPNHERTMRIAEPAFVVAADKNGIVDVEGLEADRRYLAEGQDPAGLLRTARPIAYDDLPDDHAQERIIGVPANRPAA